MLYMVYLGLKEHPERSSEAASRAPVSCSRLAFRRIGVLDVWMRGFISLMVVYGREILRGETRNLDGWFGEWKCLYKTYSNREAYIFVQQAPWDTGPRPRILQAVEDNRIPKYV
jgi:hypothetical protein